MRLDEGQKAFILLGLAEKLESDAARAHRPHHGGDFDRRFILGDDDFQVKNVVNMHLSFTLDDATAQREVHHDSLASHFPSGKGQAKPYRNTEMFTAIHGRRRSGESGTAAKKPMATVSTMIRNNPNQCGGQFTRRLWPHTKRSILSTSRTDHFTTHSICLRKPHGKDRRMQKKPAQQGRSEREVEAYAVGTLRP